MTQHPLFHFTRQDHVEGNTLEIDPQTSGMPPTKAMIGSFYEPLGHATLGVIAELLVNPTFASNHNLSDIQQERLCKNGQSLVQLYLNGIPADGLDASWHPQIMSTGFGLSVLDDATREGIPFGWGPLGYAGAVSSSLGRLGESVRLQGGNWPTDQQVRWTGLDEGPAGVRQGIFLPIRRCQDYTGDVWVRIASTESESAGEIEIGFRRRISTPDNNKQAGEILDSLRLDVAGKEWVNLSFALSLVGKNVAFGEPIDFYVRWLPRSDAKLNLLLDRAVIFPEDALDGFDPEIVQITKDWPVPLLRWPGGNFVSFFHWRDGVGPVENRPTIKNQAWGGIEYNLFGTDEYLLFCRHIGAEPHITVNSGTGNAEEAAAWVEYCNGDVSTPMGQLRARNGHPEPYNVKYWEVGNENFGSWQGGTHGSDENARRFSEFAPAMRAASPIPIQLIACGNGFDFADGGKGYDYTTADGRWHEQLLKQAPDEIDYISLHAMPANHYFLQGHTDDEASYAVLGQITTWENRFLPELLAACDRATPNRSEDPIKLAITEWAAVGENLRAVHVENFGSVVYGGAFLHMMIRNAERIPLANTTGYMHGGCLRRAFGIPYYDPQYLVIQQYQHFAGATPLACHLSGPGFDVDYPADIGAVERDIPFLDAVVCKPATSGGLLLAIANKHMHDTQSLQIKLPDMALSEVAEIDRLAYPRLEAYVTPANPDRFVVEHFQTPITDGVLNLELPPFSVIWVRI